MRDIVSGSIRRFKTLWAHMFLAELGRGSWICRDVRVYGAGNIHIGADVTVNDGVVLHAPGDQKIIIEDGVTLSFRAMVLTGMLDHQRRKVHNWREVRIQRHAWIGAGAILLPGVTVGEGAIVAAGAVVAADIAPRIMVAGVPAVVKKTL